MGLATLEAGDDFSTKRDDDGRLKRTGTMVTASAHIITAVIGSGVLSLAWALAQLGWIAGPMAILGFAGVTWFTSGLLADSYRHPVTGQRNYTYMACVKNSLGGINNTFCGIAQYGTFVGTSIGYTITSAISMAAIKKSNCYHKHGHDADCRVSDNVYMIIFGVAQIILSQIPNFHELDGLSVIAAIMSFGYAFIGIGLSIAKVVEGRPVESSSLTGQIVGVDVATSSEKMFNIMAALGNIAFGYAYTTVLVEIQDTLKQSPPESKVMRKAASIGVSVTTFFYMLCGVLGYAAFGNKAPGNFLTGFGFYDPFWLVDFANVCIIVHLVGAYQVFTQPTFRLVEDHCRSICPESKLITIGYNIGGYNINVFRIVWRTMFVMLTTLIAIVFPFFNSVLGLLGAFAFWPLVVYFPIQMYIKRSKTQRFTFAWTWLHILSGACFITSVLAAVGSVEGIIKDLRTYKPFTSVS